MRRRVQHADEAVRDDALCAELDVPVHRERIFASASLRCLCFVGLGRSTLVQAAGAAMLSGLRAFFLGQLVQLVRGLESRLGGVILRSEWTTGTKLALRLGATEYETDTGIGITIDIPITPVARVPR